MPDPPEVAPVPARIHVRPLRPLRAALLDALALVLPVACAACGAPDRSVCADCLGALRPTAVRVSREDAPGWGGLAAWAGLEYAGTAARVIRSLKDSGRTDAAPALAPALRAALSGACGALAATGERPPRLELASVPSTPAARRQRGYDPVRLLLRRAGFRPVDVLVARPTRLDQAALGRDARRANAAGSIAARHPLDGRAFLLVDDVVTTGSTLAEAARAIRSAGGTVLGAAVLAHTPRRFPAPREPMTNVP